MPAPAARLEIAAPRGVLGGVDGHARLVGAGARARREGDPAEPRLVPAVEHQLLGQGAQRGVHAEAAASARHRAGERITGRRLEPRERRAVEGEPADVVDARHRAGGQALDLPDELLGEGPHHRRAAAPARDGLVDGEAHRAAHRDGVVEAADGSTRVRTRIRRSTVRNQDGAAVAIDLAVGPSPQRGVTASEKKSGEEEARAHWPDRGRTLRARQGTRKRGALRSRGSRPVRKAEEVGGEVTRRVGQGGTGRRLTSTTVVPGVSSTSRSWGK